MNSMLLGTALLASLLSAIPVCAQKQSALNGEACSTYAKTDAELNSAYRSIQASYAKDAIFLQKLKASQRAWLAYRDAQLDALYPAPDKQTEYGSMYPTCRCIALQRLSEQRTRELRKWLDGVAEGDTCAGSIRHAHSN